MTDRSKFEQMLEYLISEEEDKAKELFHQLVVEKSREIYETILAEDFTEAKEEDDEDMEEAKEEDDEEELDEASEDEDEEMDENFGFEAADEEEGGDDEGGEVGGDATDDFMGDIEAGDDEGDMGGEGDIEDRVMDLEDALDELKSEFEKMMGDDEEMPGDDMGGMDDMGGDEMGMDSEEPKMDSFNVSDNFMREYIEKVTNPKNGDNGDNTKSIIDNMKNDMGGTTANMVKGGTEGGKGVQSGLLKPNTKEENFGNINVPGGRAGKTAFKKKEPGHGAEKKGSGDNGDNKTSPISGLKSRAK
jgi:hypothetical protein